MENLAVAISVKQLSEVIGDVSMILSSIDEAGRGWFLQKTYDILKVKIDYPLDNPTEIKIENASLISDILVPVAQFYKNVVYSNPEKFGVYGHDIGDLVFEGISIDDEGNVELSIGS